MARSSPIQESFASGEISQNVRGRVSSEVYDTGLKFCENWTPQVQGSIRTRDGFRYHDDMDPRNSVARLFTYSVGLDQDFIVEVGDAFIIVRDGNTGLQAIGGESTNLVEDPTYQQELTSWTYQWDFYRIDNPVEINILSWQHAEDSFTQQLITQPDFFLVIQIDELMMGPDLRQKILVPTGTDILDHDFLITYLLSMIETNQEDMGVPNMTDCEIVIRIGTTETGTEIREEIIPITDIGPGTISFSFIPGAGVTEYWLGIGARWDSPPNTIPPDNPFLRGPQLYDTFDFKFGPVSINTALPGGSGSPVEFTSPYTTAELLCSHFAMDPGEGELWFTSGNNKVEPYQLTFNGVVWTWTALSAVAGFAAPSPNVWAVDNHPSAVAIRDGRLYLANVPTQRATIWGSKSGDYVDFDGSAAANPEDPLLFPLAVAGRITGLSNRKQLVINTDVSEVVAASSLPGNVIAFNDFGFPNQTDWGSSCVQSVKVGRQTVYASPSNKK
ncbi:hypothetical protein LCGC14_2411490, partial [marine sediment metagenome]